MPDYETIVDGKSLKVELTRKSPESFAAKVGGKLRDVKLGRKGALGDKAFALEIDGKKYQIELPRTEHHKIVTVSVDGATFEVNVKIARKGQELPVFESTSRTTKKEAVVFRKGAPDGAVTAPMTGKIVRINIKKGDQVEAGQVLCVIEAMKMENEICATKAGTVQDVAASEGTPVNEGDTLLVIV